MHGDLRRLRRLQVGDWCVDGNLNEIDCAGKVVHLEPKAMAVLLILAERPGEVVTRDELLATVWPDVIVSDNALTQVIIKLRRALEDTPREPKYLQSIAKSGYRLIAEVRPAVDSPTRNDATAVRPSPQRYSARTAGMALALALAAVVSVTAAAWFVHLARGPSASSAMVESSDELPNAAPPTVRVQPFEALGTDTEETLLARAVTADLVTDLSKVAALSVVTAEAGNDGAASGGLQARYVLSGTVQRDGNRLRLNVLLADARASRQVWSERFDADDKDLFDVQDRLVRRVIEVLPVRVSEAESLRLAQRSTRNLEAYRQFSLAQAALLVRRPAENEAARAFYWEAIRRDPAFARAYAGLAMTYALAYQQGWVQEGDAALARALEFAQTALRMRPDMPEAHWVMAFVATQRRQHDEGLRHLDDALRLNGSYADAYALKAGILTYVGMPEEAIPLMQSALRLNPAAGSLYFLLLGRAYHFRGDFEQARFHLSRAIERNPENLEAGIYLAATHWRLGDREAALWQMQEIRQLEPEFEIESWLANYPLTDADARQMLRRSMSELGSRAMADEGARSAIR
ncbi:winged helix-turn-helix domain-containing protein [Piscinibacter sp.]|uniref:winged helix-turn-helix domain-containing protein n=1 Tax=Piscinibacter sp. TaxID=1903157 RepID=UPI002CA8D730|nr:winged helix-turn-helix domain-containing protein [Albitalea sp.]HUG24796.1 winged helix-turn-helix domain-containing protein [Albitalea sp.]